MIAGLQPTLEDGLAYSFAAFEQGENWSEPLPPSLVAQVRFVVQIGMPLDELLRGYSAGNTVISYFVAQEAAELSPEVLRYAVGVQSRVADALIGGLSAEYARQSALLERSPAQRVADQVERLLAGEPVSAEQIGYRLDAWHIAGVVSGPEADQAARLLAERLGCELLLVSRAAELVWAWWGGPRRIPFAQLDRVAGCLERPVSFAVGESRQGVEGFRLSHREARVACTVAVRQAERLTRCADVMLPGLLLRDGSSADLFLDAYLGGLKAQRDWPSLRETLLAYFDAGASFASAAASLAVDRHTVRRRLRKVEEITERPLSRNRGELEVALRLDRLVGSDLSGRRHP